MGRIMAAIDDPVALSARPLFEPVGAWLRIFGGECLPGTEALNRALDTLAERPCAASGRPIRFVPPGGVDAAYEERVFQRGEIETRPDDWHDFFNALAWLAYPRAKRALNGRHHAALQAQRAAGRSERGALRDAATQFDECGIAVACAAPALIELIRRHAWKDLFWARRAELAREMRFFVFGHATWDQLRAPFLGLTAKAVLIDVGQAWLSLPIERQRADIDGWLAEIFSRGEAFSRPGDFQPLPLLGIPGVVAASASPDYFDDARQFRPARKKRGPAEAGPALEQEV